MCVCVCVCVCVNVLPFESNIRMFDGWPLPVCVCVLPTGLLWASGCDWLDMALQNRSNHRLTDSV